MSVALKLWNCKYVTYCKSAQCSRHHNRYEALDSTLWALPLEMFCNQQQTQSILGTFRVTNWAKEKNTVFYYQNELKRCLVFLHPTTANHWVRSRLPLVKLLRSKTHTQPGWVAGLEEHIYTQPSSGADTNTYHRQWALAIHSGSRFLSLPFSPSAYRRPLSL